MRKEIMNSIEAIENSLEMNVKFIDYQYYLKMRFHWILFYIVQRIFYKQNQLFLFLLFLKKSCNSSSLLTRNQICCCNKPKVGIISSVQKRNLLSNWRQFCSTVIWFFVAVAECSGFWSRLERVRENGMVTKTFWLIYTKLVEVEIERFTPLPMCAQQWATVKILP